jgi:hypothetical protein
VIVCRRRPRAAAFIPGDFLPASLSAFAIDHFVMAVTSSAAEGWVLEV